MRVSVVYAFAVLLAVLAPVSMYGQASETIEVSIVNVDVFVTDKAGNRVRGLTKDDFEVRENGQLQPVTNFTEYRGAAGSVSVTPAPAGEAAPAAEVAKEQRPKRTIVLFIESFALPHFRTKPMFDSMRALLRSTVQKGDAVSIVSWMNMTHVRQELTDDLAALERALDEIEKESSGVDRGRNTLATARQQDELEKAWTKSVNSSLVEKGFAAMDERSAHSIDALARLQMLKIRQKTAAVNSLMQSFAGIEGKKVLILATQRFGVYGGAEYYNGEVPFRMRGELDTRKLRETLTRTANASNITIYPMYPVGFSWNPNSAADTRADITSVDADADAQRLAADDAILLNETAALNEIAQATGGRMASGSAEVIELLPRISEDLESYYSLAYRAPSGRKKDTPRDIVVRAKNRDYVVRARRAAVEKSEGAKMHDRVVANLFRNLDGVLPIAARVGEAKKAKKKRRSIPLQIQVPIGALTLLPDGQGASGEFSVFVAAGGLIGVLTDVQEQTQKFSIKAADLERARRSHFTYDFELVLDEFADRISVGVLDGVSKDYGLTTVALGDGAS